MNTKIFVSVICPIYNEEKYIEKCINSILQQDFPKSDIEILFIDGMSSDKTREIITTYTKVVKNIRLLDNPNKTVPYAMNKGIQEAKGEIIIRLDAHASYENNYISTLVKKLIELKADNVGAYCKTDVLNINKKTLAIKEVLSNKFGVGNSQFRLGVNVDTEVDTVPFGCWKKEVFNKYGLFDIRLTRNQDIEFNKRILRRGGHIYLVTGTYCIYYARETIKALSKNAYQNGVWNILTIIYTGEKKSLSIRHFVPFFFVISLIIPSLLSILYWPLIFISLMSLVSYLFLFTCVSIKLAITKRLSFYYLIICFFCFHISYGFGSIVGLLKSIFKRNKKN